MMVQRSALPTTKSRRQVCNVCGGGVLCTTSHFVWRWFPTCVQLLITFLHSISLLTRYIAYELKSKEKRRENHLRYGLVLCTHTLHESRTESNELFFTSITQINHGGPDIVHDPSEKSTIAGLNLKAGRLSISLSDYAAAFTLFEHGISYLGSDKWASNYDLSIELYDAAAEAACVLNKRDRVGFHVGELVAHAKTFDDSVHCKFFSHSCTMYCLVVNLFLICSFSTSMQVYPLLQRHFKMLIS